MGIRMGGSCAGPWNNEICQQNGDMDKEGTFPSNRVKYITVKITGSLPCMWTDKGAEAQGPFLGSIVSESGVEQSHLPQVLSLLLGGSK